jgi:hypothetical protein
MLFQILLADRVGGGGRSPTTKVPWVALVHRVGMVSSA